MGKNRTPGSAASRGLEVGDPRSTVKAFRRESRRDGTPNSHLHGPHTSVTDQVVDAIRTLLRSGEYGVGDRLPSELELTERLGVGRSAVREAIRELATLSLLDVRHGRGTYVRSLRVDLLGMGDDFRSRLNRTLALEYLEVRRIIEPESAALAAVRAGPDELRRLAQDVERLDEAVRAGYRPPEDLGFHLDVIRATRNGALGRMAGSIVAFYQRDEHLPTDRDVREHALVLEAIRAGDPAAARGAMRAHLAQEESLIGSLDA